MVAGKSNWPRWLRRGLPLGLLILLGGCGKSSGTVSGKVTYKGETLGGGTVTFITAEGKNGGSSRIGPDGSYSIANVPLGEVRIAVETKTAQAAAPPPNTIPKVPDNLPPEAQKSIYKAAPQGKHVPIPDFYADTQKSGLTLVVKGGEQPHNIELK